MGGGPLDYNNYIPLTEQHTYMVEQEFRRKQQESLLQQEKLRKHQAQQEQQKQSTESSGSGSGSSSNRLNYNPNLNNSIESVYPVYDPNDFQIDSVPLAIALPPVLPPIPEAYRKTTRLISDEQISPLPTKRVTVLPTATTTTTNKQQVRMIYTKSGFYLKSDNPFEPENSIHGFFAIFSRSMENVEILIAWIPEHLIESHDIPRFIELDGILASDHDFPAVDLNFGEQGETTAISLKNVYSLHVSPPTGSGQGYIVITSCSGDMLKPIWYSSLDDNTPSSLSWPGYDIIDILSSFTPIKSQAENMYMIQPLPTTVAESEKPTFMTSQKNNPTTEDPFTRVIRDTRWNILERFSKVTQYSMETASQVLNHPIARPILPLLPPTAVRALHLDSNPQVQNTVNEYQMASHYIARFGGNHNNNTESNYHLDDDVDGLLKDMSELRGPTPIHTRRSPVTPEEWLLLFDDQGRLDVDISYMKEIIFQGGLDPDIRIEAWKFLLGIYPWRSNFDEREAIRRSRSDLYFATKSTWFDNTEIRNTKEFMDEKHRIDKDVHRTDRNQEAFVGDELPNPDPNMDVGTNANLEIMKDILVTYNFHNTELGYVQGMSDLLAPLFVAMGDEAMAFWGFSMFMERVESNFYIDQTGMHKQLGTLNSLIRFMDPKLYKRLEETDTSNLFFCFRWLLVWFKREFEWEDVIRLWEVLWTNHLTDKMILFVALAVVDAHRRPILEELNQFDQVLRYINDLTGNIPLEPTLERAEVLFYQFERKVRAMQHKKSMLKAQLQIRSVWNSSERANIQDSIEKLEIPLNLLELLPSIDNSTTEVEDFFNHAANKKEKQ